MNYSSNPLLPKASADAVRLVVENRLPIAITARRSSVYRVTLWRWHKQWLEINQKVQLTNDNRPRHRAGVYGTSSWRLAACTWQIPTRSSRPHSCNHAVAPSLYTPTAGARVLRFH